MFKFSPRGCHLHMLNSDVFFLLDFSPLVPITLIIVTIPNYGLDLWMQKFSRPIRSRPRSAEHRKSFNFTHQRAGFKKLFLPTGANLSSHSVRADHIAGKRRRSPYSLHGYNYYTYVRLLRAMEQFDVAAPGPLPAGCHVARQDLGIVVYPP